VAREDKSDFILERDQVRKRVMIRYGRKKDKQGKGFS
jgi:hypothetical protein